MIPANLILVTPPASEPVTAADLMIQLGMGTISDDGLATELTQQLTRAVVAARTYCDGYLRRTFVQQEWLAMYDHFPHGSGSYNRRRNDLTLPVPSPPFISVSSFKYVDLAGELQDLPADTTYGADPNLPAYAYVLERGSDTRAARLHHAYSRFWPPTRRVPGAVQLTFRCGFGGPMKVSLAEGPGASATGAFVAGDVLRPITIPGAGPAGGPLVTTIIAVVDGAATLADEADVAVDGVQAYIGKPIPEDWRMAILLLAQFYYEQGGSMDMAIPRVIYDLLGTQNKGS